MTLITWPIGAFLSALMAHPRWRAGKLSTGFIAEEFPDGFHPHPPKGEQAHVLAAVATLIDHIGNQRKRRISGQLRNGAPVQFARNRVCLLGDKPFGVTLETQGEALLVRFEGEEGRAHRGQRFRFPKLDARKGGEHRR